ncbi:MAG: COX15/CtaA family protein [Nevskia sp.]
MSLFRRLNLLTLVLCYGLVVLGAFVRLSNAGLGCPDWPGCYGQVGVPGAAHEIAAAQANFPDRPVEAPKAWKEMLHRYLAGGVGLLIVALAAVAWRDPSGRLPRRLALATIAVVLVQIVFGALTVTLKVNPLIVTTHLMLGLSTLSLLWWMWLETGRIESAAAPAAAARREARNERQAWQQMTASTAVAAPARGQALLRPLALLALGLLIAQIFLGGWTSTNYAALACPDFPACHGSFLPKTDLADAFKLWHGHDIDYEYGILDVAARATVHLVHRYGALLLSLVLGSVAVYLIGSGLPALRRLGLALIGALLLQVSIGIGLIQLQLPLWLADAHNAGAALLLLAVLALNHRAWTLPPRVSGDVR